MFSFLYRRMNKKLVYANTSKGPVLLGAMYLMPGPGVPGLQIGGCLTRWHAHSFEGGKLRK